MTKLIIVTGDGPASGKTTAAHERRAELAESGYTVVVTPNPAEAYNLIAGSVADYVILDPQGKFEVESVELIRTKVRRASNTRR